jgi:hypothetical protein
MLKTYNCTTLPKYPALYGYKMPGWIGLRLIKFDGGYIKFDNNSIPINIKDVPFEVEFYIISSSDFIS